MFKVDGKVSLKLIVLSNPLTRRFLGILYANFAIINPTAAYGFFTQANYDPSWLDGGASLTWYIVLSAMLGGSS